MTTTRYLCAAGLVLAAALILTVSLKYWPRIAPFLQRRPKPQMHEGATEKFGAELHALKDAPVAPELVSVPEQMAADHEALSGITRALDDFDRVVETALTRFLANQPEVRLHLDAINETTGEWDMRELDALLAVTP